QGQAWSRTHARDDEKYLASAPDGGAEWVAVMHGGFAGRLVAVRCTANVAVVTARPHPGAALRRRRAAPGAQVPGPALPTVSAESRLYWTAPGLAICDTQLCVEL